MDVSILKMKNICSVATDWLQYSINRNRAQSNVEDKASRPFPALVEYVKTADVTHCKISPYDGCHAQSQMLLWNIMWGGNNLVMPDVLSSSYLEL